MSRSLTTAMINAVNASETGDVFIILLTISQAALASPIRVCSDAVNVVSRGNTFVAFPFDLRLPTDMDNAAQKAQLTIDNIDRSIVAAIRSITSPPSLLIEIVRAAAPDTVEASFVDFKMTNIGYDAMTVTADVTVEDYTAEPYPCGQFTPSLFPGMF